MTSTPTLLAALEAAHAALDSATVRDDVGRPVGWVSAEDLTPDQLARAVQLQAELEGRVAGLRLHTVAAADMAEAAAQTAAADTGAWAASAAGRNRARSWGGVWLANLLDTKYAHVRAGLATGKITEDHAVIIVRSAERVPDGIPAPDLAECEALLVDKAQTMSPARLRRAARRLLDPLSKRLADTHEETLLTDQEQHAERETWLTLGDNGDGTFTGKFTIPELHGHLLRNALDVLTSPRRYARSKTGEPVVDRTLPAENDTVSSTERRGLAFCELLEHLPTTGHARTGITLVVHVDEEKLRTGAGAATLDTGATLSIGETRRLACNAGHLPMVLSGKSVPLDLGRSERLFSKAQAIALSALHTTCAAEGCDRPFAWCELHHLQSWGSGGTTDLDNALPLCGHHHRRIHDDRYDHWRQPDGTIRFRRHWRQRPRGRWDGSRDVPLSGLPAA